MMDNVQWRAFSKKIISLQLKAHSGDEVENKIGLL